MVHGHMARSSWRWDEQAGTLEYRATVPFGFTASLVLPAKCGGGGQASAVSAVLTSLLEGEEGGDHSLLWSADEGAAVATTGGVNGMTRRGASGGDFEVELRSGVFRFAAAFASWSRAVAKAKTARSSKMQWCWVELRSGVFCFAAACASWSGCAPALGDCFAQP
jgi:hypothetical protein